MLKLLIIGAGGFIGSVSRYLISGTVYRIMGKPYFPYGTLAVNLLGCFLIGLLSGVSETRQLFNPEMRLFLFIGLLGGFTTFSTFGYEVFSFARDGQMLSSLVNILLHVFLGLGMVWVGYSLSIILLGD
jgi:CrcB protein